MSHLPMCRLSMLFSSKCLQDVSVALMGWDSLSSYTRWRCVHCNSWQENAWINHFGCPGEVFGYEVRRVATKNLDLTTNVICSCISLPWVAMDKLQQIVGMDQFFLGVTITMAVYTCQMGVAINCMLKLDLSKRWINGTNLHGLVSL